MTATPHEPEPVDPLRPPAVPGAALDDGELAELMGTAGDRPLLPREPLLSGDELAALMPELPDALPSGLTRGVESFFSRLGELTEPTRPERPDAEAEYDDDGDEPLEGDGDEESRSSPLAADLTPPRQQLARAAVLEVALLYALAVGAEVGLGGSAGSFRLHPHPYWLIVLPMAAARGLWAGLLAAGIGTAIYAWGAARALQPDSLVQLLDYRVLLEPILFAFAAFFVGQFRDDLQQRYRKLWRVFQHQRDEALRLTRQNDRLVKRNREYQARLLDHSAQFGNLIDVARRLENADAHEIHELSLDMLVEHCGALRCSLLVVKAVGAGDEPDQVELVTARGWPEPMVRLLTAATARSPLVRRAVHDAMAVDGLAADTPAATDGPLMVAPIFDAAMTVRALLCLEELPADRYSAHLFDLFRAVADWTGVSLQRLEAGRRLREFAPAQAAAAAAPAALWIGTPQELGERVRLEDARTRQQGMTSCLIAVQAADLVELPSDDDLTQLDARAMEMLTGCLRASDSVYDFGYAGCWLVVLPDTPVGGGEVVVKRISRRLHFLDGGELGAVRMRAWAPDDDHPDLESLLAEIGDDFRLHTALPFDVRCPTQVPQRPSIGTTLDLVRQMRVELDLSMRCDLELYVAEVEYGGGDEATRDAFEQQLAAVHGAHIRGTDRLYRIVPGRFALLIPASDGVQAFSVLGGMLEALEHRVHESSMEHVRSQVFAVSGMAGEAQGLLAQLAAQAEQPTDVPAAVEPPADADAPTDEAEPDPEPEPASLAPADELAAALGFAAPEPTPAEDDGRSLRRELADALGFALDAATEDAASPDPVLDSGSVLAAAVELLAAAEEIDDDAASPAAAAPRRRRRRPARGARRQRRARARRRAAGRKRRRGGRR